MRRLYALLLPLALLFVACASTPSPNAKPSWIMQANQEGKIGAIGVAGRTYDQSFSTQRKLAITRALDELSLQQGVEVKLNMQKSEQSTNSTSHTQIDERSSYSASNSVTAHIEDVWMDKNTNEFYVWMVLDNGH